MKTKYIILCAIGLGVYVFCFTSGVLYILKPKTIYNSHATLSSAKKTTPLSHRAARIHYGNSIDTLWSNDTIYFYPIKDKEISGEFRFLMVVDSLSGSTNATIMYETNLMGVVWVPVKGWAKMVANGSTQQLFSNQDYIEDARIRIKCVSPTASQLTRIQFAYQLR